MAAPDRMRVGDFAPVIRRQVVRGDEPVTLPTGTTVTLRLRREGSTATQTFAGEVEDAATGWVRYRWQGTEPLTEAEAAALPEPCAFWVTFEIAVPSVGRLSVPTVGEDALIVYPRGP